MTPTPKKPMVTTEEAGKRLFAKLASREYGKIIYGVSPPWVRYLISAKGGQRLRAERHPEGADVRPSTLMVPLSSIEKYNREEIEAFRKWLEGQGKSLEQIEQEEAARLARLTREEAS